MANILITEFCNLNCPYCFAKYILDDQIYADTNITARKHLKFLNWAKNIDGQIDHIKFLGGEPTINPEIDKLINLSLSKYTDSVAIFTNGLLLDRFHKYADNPKIEYLINVNTVKNLGEAKAKKIKENILNYPNKDQIALGITIYTPDMDLTFFKELLLVVNTRVRIGIASPAEDVEDKFEYYKKLKPKAMELYRYCIEDIKTKIVEECNNIPYCLFTEEEKKYFDYHDHSHLYINTCDPVVDYYCDGSLSHCLSTSSYDKIPANTFKNLDEAMAFYKILFDEIKDSVIEPKCKNCEHFGKFCSGGCKNLNRAKYKEAYEKIAPQMLEDFKNKKGYFLL